MTSLALQTALYQRLTSTLSVPVYDSVPMDTPPPYVTLDSEIAQDNTPVSGKTRERRLLYLSVWSNYQGQKEVKAIMGEIKTALHRTKLVLESGRAFGLSVDSQRTNREPDGITFQGAVTLSVLTQ